MSWHFTHTDGVKCGQVSSPIRCRRLILSLRAVSTEPSKGYSPIQPQTQADTFHPGRGSCSGVREVECAGLHSAHLQSTPCRLQCKWRPEKWLHGVISNKAGDSEIRKSCLQVLGNNRQVTQPLTTGANCPPAQERSHLQGTRIPLFKI
jgi:hypothetical protein